jgi:hypothetical protein
LTIIAVSAVRTSLQLVCRVLSVEDRTTNPAATGVGEDEDAGAEVVGRAERALVAADAAAAAEVIEGLAGPLRLRGDGGPLGGGGVVERGDLVDGAVDRAALDADDVGELAAAVDVDLLDVGGDLGRIGERDELAAEVLVEELVAGRDAAVVVLRVAEAGLLGAAVERGLVRAGDHRAGDRVVGDEELGDGLLRGGCGEGGLAEREAVDEAEQAVAADLREAGGDVDVAGEHGDLIGGDVGGEADLDEGVAAGDGVGARGQDAQLEGGGLVGREVGGRGGRVVGGGGAGRCGAGRVGGGRVVGRGGGGAGVGGAGRLAPEGAVAARAGEQEGRGHRGCPTDRQCRSHGPSVSGDLAGTA